MTEYIYEHKPSGADHMGKPVELPMLVQREEIVRCRDCKHFEYCQFHRHSENKPDGFCAWSERRGA